MREIEKGTGLFGRVDTSCQTECSVISRKMAFCMGVLGPDYTRMELTFSDLRIFQAGSTGGISEKSLNLVEAVVGWS